METRDGVVAKAERQMRTLEIEGKIKEKRSSSSSSVTRVLSPTTSTTSDHGDKKLPMNKITVGHAPSPQISKATSKIGSLANTSYKPSGGNVKIESKKLEWNVKSKIGSLGNVGHVPGGGGVKIPTQKIKIETKSRINSLQNVKHQAGGGDKKIFDDKEYARRSGGRSQGGRSQDDQSRRSSSLARGD